jgi:TolB protein
MLRVVFGVGGKRLAYIKGRTVRNIFRAPILIDRPATWADITQLTFDEAEFESLDVSRAGEIVASSDRAGNWDVWTLSATGGGLQQLTTDPAIDAGPRWSPDGRQVAFYSLRTGNRELWIMPIGDGPARQITRGESDSYYPAWSPDGLEIAREANGLGVVPVRGGQARSLTTDPGDLHADWSPDGKWVAFDSSRDGTRRLWRVPASGGQLEQLTKGAARLPRWSLDGKQVYFIGLGDRANNVWLLSIGNRKERPVTALTDRRGALGSLGLAIDAKYIYFTWEESRGDIWVADVIQPPDQ